MDFLDKKKSKKFYHCSFKIAEDSNHNYFFVIVIAVVIAIANSTCRRAPEEERMEVCFSLSLFSLFFFFFRS